MAINDLGHRTISLTGSQAGIVTDTSHARVALDGERRACSQVEIARRGLR